jgi:hypothetical protein
MYRFAVRLLVPLALGWLPSFLSRIGKSAETKIAGANSIFYDRLNLMAKKIQEGRRVMSTLDQCISSEVRRFRGPESQFLESWFAVTSQSGC